MMAGVGHEKSVTDSLTCTPPRKIRARFQECKHTSLIFSVVTFSELRLDGVLRRLMCNELYEQIRQVAQRSAERVVDLLCAGVGRDLGGQARQQPSQRLRTMPL